MDLVKEVRHLEKTLRNTILVNSESKNKTRELLALKKHSIYKKSKNIQEYHRKYHTFLKNTLKMYEKKSP